MPKYRLNPKNNKIPAHSKATLRVIANNIPARNVIVRGYPIVLTMKLYWFNQTSEFQSGILFWPSLLVSKNIDSINISGWKRIPGVVKIKTGKAQRKTTQ